MSPAQRKLRAGWIVIALISAIAGSLITLGVMLIVQSQDHNSSAKPAATKASAVDWTKRWTVSSDGYRVVKNSVIKQVPVAGSDSYGVATMKRTFNGEVAGDPFYDCPDGRNRDVTWSTTDELRPCVNGSLHIRLEHGKLSVIDSTMPASTVIFRTVKFASKADAHSPSPVGWDITKNTYYDKMPVTETTYKTVPMFSIDYDANPSFYTYRELVKLPGGAWHEATNLNDQSWGDTEKAEFVFTWQDPSRPLKDAPVPFDWTKVQLTP